MSGLTPLPITEFRRMLRCRPTPLTMDDFAFLVGRSRPQVSQVLHGHRTGGRTWALIKEVCTEEEWAELLKLEHCATWNRRNQAKRARQLV